jgi:fluoroquinolone resistance protein
LSLLVIEMAFIESNYYQQHLADISLSNETVKAIEFEECCFEGCSFIDFKFEKCKFIGCRFEGCVLSAINPENSVFSEVKFIKCKVIGCDWTKTSQISELSFEECQINYSNFAMMKIPRMKMINCEAKEANFTNTDLTDGSFTGTDFEKSIFSRTNLTRANLKGSVNYYIDPRHNTLKKTSFSLPEAMSLLNCLDIIIE